MLEKIIIKYNFNKLYDFFETIKEEITNEKIEQNHDTIIITANLKKELTLKIFITNQFNSMELISFYINKNDTTLEKIEFAIINNNNYNYNRVIKHDYLTFDENITTTFNSGYLFINNNYNSGWENIRKIYYKDIENYIGKDNIANLSCNIDNNNIEILYKEDKTNIEEEPIIIPITLEKEKKLINK